MQPPGSQARSVKQNVTIKQAVAFAAFAVFTQRVFCAIELVPLRLAGFAIALGLAHLLAVRSTGERVVEFERRDLSSRYRCAYRAKGVWRVLGEQGC